VPADVSVRVSVLRHRVRAGAAAGTGAAAMPWYGDLGVRRTRSHK
jgi:hypothetical protein